jgi:hypothetical protein
MQGENRARKRLRNLTCIVVAIAGAAGCSLILKFDPECSSDHDCASKGANFHCVSQYCVSQTVVGGDGGTPIDGAVSCDSWDAASGQCFACMPNDNAQLLNACTTGCIQFDDSKVTKLYSDGGVPPVPDVPDSGTGGAG